MKFASYVIAGIIMFVTPALSQEQRVVTVDVASSSSGEKESYTYLNGYASAIEGQVISYHSSHPDAESALLVRARRDVRKISWRSDTLGRPNAGGQYRLVWLTGIERAGWGGASPSHRFTLSVNGTPWLTFSNRKDSTAVHWTEHGSNGSTLEFRSMLADKFDDLFGLMFLTVPEQFVTPGAPLTLSVEGEEANSPDWFMAFQYSFAFTPSLKAEPALVRDGSGVTQQIRISLDNLDGNNTAVIRYPGHDAIRMLLSIGANIVRITVPAVEKPEMLEVVYSREGKETLHLPVRLEPITRRDIYLVPHTHNDIGYTDLQPEVEKKQWRNLDQALRLIHQTDTCAPEAQFRWNMEILWPFESYMAKAVPEKRKEVFDAIRAGRLGLNALYVNPLTGLASSPEMDHLTEYARSFTAKTSIPITTAAISDIPGYTWGLVNMLARSGVKYLASAPNSGDRIGYVLDDWGDKPFYWKSQSGRDSILMWVAGSSYASFHEGTLTNLGPDKVMKFVRSMDAKGYPYSMYYLPYTLGDNGAPDSTLSRFVSDWNRRYVSPRLVISTHQKLFEDFTALYGSSLPTYAGDFTPYWEDGAASTARETALGRKVSDRLVQNGILWSICNPLKYPVKKFYDAWKGVVLWDEHTWGASGSVTDPDSPMTTGQWRYKQAYILDADSVSREIEAGTDGKAGSSYDVWNTSSWPRTDLVTFTAEQSRKGDAVVDEKGKPLPSQRLSTGELAVLMKDVPPFSSRRITLRGGHPGKSGEVMASTQTLYNEYLSLSVDSSTGGISTLVRSQTDKVIASMGANGVYYYIAGTNPDSAQHLKNISVRVREKGPLVGELEISGDAAGCRKYSSRIRLISGLMREDIIIDLDKERVREKEGMHIGFEWPVPDGVMRYDVADNIVVPERDQLKGSCKNFVSAASWVDVSNDGGGVTWTTPDASLVEPGAINAESPWMKSVTPGTKWYSYVMNNYWHTNYKADQDGPMEFRYSLYPHNGFNPLASAREGRESRQPLLVRPAGSLKGGKFPLSIPPDNLIVESMEPFNGGTSWLVSIYNPSASDVVFPLKWKGKATYSAHGSDLSGTTGAPFTGSISVPAAATIIVRVDSSSK